MYDDIESFLKQYASASGKDVHLDVPLSNFAVSAFAEGDDQFVAEQLMPEVPVGNKSDKYYIIDKGNFFRVEDTKRAPKSRANRVTFGVSSESYNAENYALAGDNAIEDVANADNALMLRQNTVRLVTTQLRRDQERRIANLVTSISNVGSGVQLTGTNKWGDSASDPIADVTTGHAFMRSQTGLVANTAVIDWDTLQVVRRHPLLLDMFKYTSGGRVTDAQLMEVFKVQRMLVGMGIVENALEGGTSSMTNIWGNNLVLAHVGANTGMQSVTFGVRFRWRPAGMPAPFAVLRSTENAAGSRHIEIVEEMYFQDEKIVGADLAYVIADTL